jgi:DNA repair exonuclease SbcCD ATPase subunit
MSERERVPLRDVLANAKSELLEARRELERARQQIQTQHKTVEQELGNLSKLRDELASDRAAAERVADQFRADWENFRASLEAFGQLAQGLQKQHDALVQLVQSKDEDLKAALKALNVSAASFKQNLDQHQEYGEVAGVMDSAIKEIKLQREQFEASSGLFKDSFEKLLAERKALTEELAALRAEREKRLKARTQDICPSCGRKVAPKDVFCDRCGASLL